MCIAYANLNTASDSCQAKDFSVKLTQKLLKRNHAEVLQQNLYAHQDQDKTARKFCAGAVFCADDVACL